MQQDVVIKNDVLNDTPFLTVGVINYNYGKYLRRNFAALQRQKFRNIELIYADNGSTDDSRSIIQEIIGEADIPVCLVAGENKGICGNRNRILDNARGKYLMFYDADDWMTDDCLETMCGKAMQTGADQIAGLYQKVDDQGKISYRHFYPDSAVKWSIWGFHGALFNMRLIRDYNLRFDLTWKADDDCFNALYHRYSQKTVFVRKVVENWCKHNDSVSSMYSDRAKKPETSYTNVDAFEKVTLFMAQIWRELPKPEQEQLEYMWSIMYYYVILYRQPALRFQDDLSEYKKIRQVMSQIFPDYQNNKALRRIEGKGYYRKKIAMVAFFMALFERFHLIKPALWGYWVITHVYKMGY